MLEKVKERENSVIIFLRNVQETQTTGTIKKEKRGRYEKLLKFFRLVLSSQSFRLQNVPQHLYVSCLSSVNGSNSKEYHHSLVGIAVVSQSLPTESSKCRRKFQGKQSPTFT